MIPLYAMGKQKPHVIMIDSNYYNLWYAIFTEEGLNKVSSIRIDYMPAGTTIDNILAARDWIKAQGYDDATITEYNLMPLRWGDDACDMKPCGNMTGILIQLRERQISVYNKNPEQNATSTKMVFDRIENDKKEVKEIIEKTLHIFLKYPSIGSVQWKGVLPDDILRFPIRFINPVPPKTDNVSSVKFQWNESEEIEEDTNEFEDFEL